MSTSRAQDLAHQIEQVILRDELQPGHHLGTKAQLQKDLDVSSGTLNEALRVLQIGGVTDARPGPAGGIFVATNSPNVKLRHGLLRFHDSGRAITECMTVRNTLEVLVAVEAARSHEPNDIHDFHHLVDKMAANSDYPRNFLAANWDLHRRLAEVGENTVLTTIYCTLMDYLEQTLEEIHPDSLYGQERSYTIQIHRNLVDAIASRDEERAASAAKMHTPNIATLPSDATDFD